VEVNFTRLAGICLAERDRRLAVHDLLRHRFIRGRVRPMLSLVGGRKG